jgi:hypothetical protein
MDNRHKGECMSFELKAFYINVKVSGKALVYAKDKQSAIDIIKNCQVTVAGNTLRNTSLTLIGKGETND